MTAAYVRLISGRLVQSDAEEWRRETEARQLLNMPLDARRELLAKIEDKRGADAATDVRAAMTEIHEAGRGAA